MELKEYEIGSDVEVDHVCGIFDNKYGFEYFTSIFSFNNTRDWNKKYGKKIVTPFFDNLEECVKWSKTNLPQYFKK